MGKVKIAETLARAGLYLGASTVGRMLKDGNAAPAEPPSPTPSQEPSDTIQERVAEPAATPAAHPGAPQPGSGRVVTAKRRNQVWHVDLTTVPVFAGFWTPWFPFALLQCWPFCWWVAVAVDHFSRRIMAVTVFKRQPTSEAVRAFLGRAIHKARKVPKYIVCDKGSQFWCEAFKAWCKHKGIRPRFGAIGHHGSIAVIERLILTIKTGCTRLFLVPYRRDHFLRELVYHAHWYNRFRPHTTLGGRTPHEVYEGLGPANRAPRFEPRARWPRGSPCAAPQTLIKGRPGVRLDLSVSYYKGRKHLPIVTLTRPA
jgi:transposase InsO family protein